MTMDSLRAFCMSLPGTHEKETWGDAEHPGDITFRVKDKIYAMAWNDGSVASVRTTLEQQAELIDTFPASVSVASYVGRFGWVHIVLAGDDALDPEIAHDIIRSAWRRTIPKSMLRELEAAES